MPPTDAGIEDADPDGIVGCEPRSRQQAIDILRLPGRTQTGKLPGNDVRAAKLCQTRKQSGKHLPLSQRGIGENDQTIGKTHAPLAERDILPLRSPPKPILDIIPRPTVEPDLCSSCCLRRRAPRCRLGDAAWQAWSRSALAAIPANPAPGRVPLRRSHPIPIPRPGWSSLSPLLLFSSSPLLPLSASPRHRVLFSHPPSASSRTLNSSFQRPPLLLL
jgi:hypothetical protein